MPESIYVRPRRIRYETANALKFPVAIPVSTSKSIPNPLHQLSLDIMEAL